MWDLHNVEIPIGPQHPALKEPASFSVTLKRREDQLGSACGSATTTAASRRPARSAPTSRTSTSSSASAASARTPIPPASSRPSRRSPASRSRNAGSTSAPSSRELERVHSHLLWLGVAGHEIGFDTLLMYTWRDREVVMDLLAALTGNRVNYGMNTIGGVRRDITAGAGRADPEGHRHPGGADEVLHQGRHRGDHADQAALRRRHAVPRGRAPPRRGRPDGPRLRRRPRRPPRRPLRRLRRAGLQGHHRQPQRRLRPHLVRVRRADGILQDDPPAR